jgi:hypothetical protein
MNVYVATGVSNAVAVFDRLGNGGADVEAGHRRLHRQEHDLKNNDIRTKDVRNGTLAGIDVRDDA